MGVVSPTRCGQTRSGLVNPAPLLKWVKTTCADWCWAGAKASEPTMIATPVSFHHTETEISIVLVSVGISLHCIWAKSPMNAAAP
ncbi:hypothetical protein [Streptomyces sp. NPDC055506]